jgi:hypothetical protein
VEVPAEPVPDACPFGDEVVPVIDEEPQSPLLAVELGNGQIGLANGGAGDGQCVDRIGLSPLPGRTARTGHESRRHAQHRLAVPQQVAFQSSREMAAVLEGETPLVPRRRPGQRVEMPVCRRRDGLLRQLAADLVDSHERVRGLVRIDADRHHGPCLLGRS